MMKIVLVVNPCSGRNKTGTLLPRVQKLMNARGIQPDLMVSRSSSHLRAIGSTLEISRYKAIVAMGGDGTTFHLVNGLLSSHPPEDLPPLGLIPAGSGNSFVRDLNILTPEQAVSTIVLMRTKSVDLIRFTGEEHRFFFLNLMGLGFVTDVAVTAQRFKCLNDLSYLIGVIRRTLSLSRTHMDIEVDGHAFSGPFCFAEFCNSRYTGGRMLMAPQARIDDGLMDVVLVNTLSRWKLITSLPRIFTGTHLQMPETTCIKGKTAQISIQSGSGMLLPDGEIMGTAPGTLEVLPRKLKVLA